MPSTQRPRRRRPNVERILLVVSIAVALIGLATVAVVGRHYYTAPARERIYSDDHALFGSSAPIGIVCGLAALLLFASNFGYVIRKGVRVMARLGSLRYWLDWHVASGIIGCGYVALHSGFEMRNLIAKTCVYALVVVIATGLVGRYLLRFVPRTESGNRADLNAFEDRVLELIDQARPALVHDQAAVHAMQALIDEIEASSSMRATARSVRNVRSRLQNARDRLRVVERALKAHPEGLVRARHLRGEIGRALRQAAVVGVAGRMMDAWRAFHRAFALLLLCAIAAHVTIALYYGYGAFWR